MTQILVNLGYLLMLAALIVRDILWLRTILVCAQLSLFCYGLATGNKAVAFWNSLFVLINSFQIIRLIRERRPIDLPEDILDLYEQVFSSLRRREFLYLWHLGELNKVTDKKIIRAGERPERIYLILKGRVVVKKGGVQVARLSRGSFFAEMSFLTGEAATADVIADGRVEYIAWPQVKLRDLKKINPGLLIKIQNILGKDLTEKLKVGSAVKSKGETIPGEDV